jgi:hypothetical protein
MIEVNNILKYILESFSVVHKVIVLYVYFQDLGFILKKFRFFQILQKLFLTSF